MHSLICRIKGTSADLDFDLDFDLFYTNVILSFLSQNAEPSIVPLENACLRKLHVELRCEVKMSASQPRDHGFEPHRGHDHDSSYDNSTG